jgi:phosphoribosylaminoimidazole carboxylase PurE protein
MGSDSDWPVMSAAGLALREFDVPFEADVVSAHRMPDAMITYGRAAHTRGLEVIIAGAGGAAHLPGMLASVTPLPVIGVPVALKYLDGMDSLLSIIQMPAGVPVANRRHRERPKRGTARGTHPRCERSAPTSANDQLSRSASAGRGIQGRSRADERTGPRQQGRLVGAAVAELIMGVGLLARGLRLITRRPRLFLLGAIPPAITSVIFTGLIIALISQLDPVVDWLTPFAEGWARGVATTIRVLVGGALLAGAVLVMVISFTTLTLALGSPLYDKLSESVEREFGEVPEFEEKVARGIFRALRQALRAYRGLNTWSALALCDGISTRHRTDRDPCDLSNLRRLDAGNRARRLPVRATRPAAARRSPCRDANAAAFESLGSRCPRSYCLPFLSSG